MRRIHFFELEDLKWFPDIIREGMMDNLKFLMKNLKVYEPIVPLLNNALVETSNDQILDLCSGGGGGIENIYKTLKKINRENISIVLTDKYPNLDAYENINKKYSSITFINEPVDAMNIPPDIKGFRTLFTSFHHFKPEDAKSILKDAVDKHAGIGIFEGSERSILGALGVIILIPILSLIITPFIKPFKWSRLFFTYIIPLIPLGTMWDGIISFLRLYNVKELLEMEKEVGNGQYEWKAGTMKHFLGVKIVYLIGTPLKS